MHMARDFFANVEIYLRSIGHGDIFILYSNMYGVYYQYRWLFLLQYNRCQPCIEYTLSSHFSYTSLPTLVTRPFEL